MFTGIVTGAGRVRSITPAGNARRLVIDLGATAEGLVPGASVAIDGVCLTVVSLAMLSGEQND